MLPLKQNIFLFLLIMSIYGSSCKKFLDAKPDQALVTPSGIADARALLDGYNDNQSRFAVLSHASSDDYYVSQEVLAGLSETDRGIYLYTIKQENLLQGIWLGGYAAINRANLVLDFLTDYQATEQEMAEKNECLGHAYFFRALRHFNLALYFTAPYQKETAMQMPGLPIRKTAAITEATNRGTLQETYDFIVSDLQNAVELLPTLPTAAYRPGKAVAYHLLAKVMMHMQRYEEALQFAEASLSIKSDLIDFNTINPTANISFTRQNAEVLFQAQISGSLLLQFNNWRVDSTLYRSYGANDLRKVVYYRSNGTNTFGFKGDYTGVISIDQFAGITTGESYMMAAEAAARSGKLQKANQWLNALLVKRYRTGSYSPFNFSDAEEAFSVIREESRKEFAGRGLRWFDLRRWNFEGVTDIEIKRSYNGITYTLAPRSKNYVFQIPANVVNMTGIAQNERE